MIRILLMGLFAGVFLALAIFAVPQVKAPILLVPSLFLKEQSQVLSTNASKKEVIGFLPYWNLKSVPTIPYDKLTTIYYFAIDIDGEGNFNQSDSGFLKLKSDGYNQLKEKFQEYPHIRRGLTIVSLDADNIARIANNSTRQDRLIKNTLKLMKDEGFQDLNFDFEYFGDLDPTLIKNYTALVKKITVSVHEAIPDSRVTLDTYADSVAKKRIFDVPELAKIVDQIIIMGYDFHRLSSLKAGPIAPLFGKDKYEYEIYQSIIDYLKYVPNEKLVLAVPFYGYEWPTQDSSPDSFVIRSIRGPEISSYKRSLETAKENNAVINFDDNSKSAWFSYFDKGTGTFRQVWFENERSLGLKFDLINQADLAGAGIWALGYDGSDSGLLWQTISDKFSH